MKLKKIELRNYRQHHELDAEFNGNLIAVVGKNGSGKSNFLGAIQFALTGEQPGFTKEDLLSWGAEAGSVELAFEHDGVECLVQRRIEKPAATLTVGNDKITGTKKVQEAMDEMIGVDRNMFRQSVFVGQGSIADVLSGNANNEEAFQKLTGLDAKSYNRFLVEFLAAAERPKDLTDEIGRYTELVATQKAALAKLGESVAGIDAKLALFPDDDISTRIADLNSKASLARDAFSKHASMLSAKAALDAFTQSHPGAGEAERVDTSKAHARISEINAYRLECRNLLSKYDEFNRVSGEIARLEGKMESFEGLDTKIDEANSLKEEIAAKKAELAQLNELVSKAPDGNKCPLCGSTVDHDIRKELTGKVVAVSADINGLASRLRELGDLAAISSDRSRTLASLDASRASLRSIGDLVQPPPDWDSSTSAELASLNAVVSKADDTNAAIERERAELSVLLAEADRTASLYAEAIAKIPGNPDPSILGRVADNIGNAVADLLKRQEELSSLKAEKARLDGMVQQAVETVRQSEEAIARLRETQKANAVAAEKLKVVEDVKDWFSYRNGPRVVSQAIMAMLTDSTNRYLDKFGAAFSVVPLEEGMGFRCVFNDGRYVPNPPPDASMLSGGQKVQLAVSFRFAVYSMFAGKLGLLVLDEPTVFLDDEAVAKFGDMLSTIKEVAQNLDIQVLVSTHEHGIMSAFDQIIEIGPKS